MKRLQRLTERVWVYPFEEARDRPNLVYIRGGRWSLAADAGHSEDHVRAFYRALEEEGLPLPELTVLTHWHWDHTFGMHAVHGLCLACAGTQAQLLAFRERLAREGAGFFLAMHESIRREYEGGRRIVVTGADMVFRGGTELDAGDCPIRVMEADGPHTEDTVLLEVPSEKVLILGDADCGPFQGGKADPALASKLARTIREMNAGICIPGHGVPLSRESVLEDLARGD